MELSGIPCHKPSCVIAVMRWSALCSSVFLPCVVPPHAVTPFACWSWAPGAKDKQTSATILNTQTASRHNHEQTPPTSHELNVPTIHWAHNRQVHFTELTSGPPHAHVESRTNAQPLSRVAEAFGKVSHVHHEQGATVRACRSVPVSVPFFLWA